MNFNKIGLRKANGINKCTNVLFHEMLQNGKRTVEVNYIEK